MNFKNNLNFNLFSRQLNLRKSFNPAFYNEKIIQSCFDSCQSLFYLTRIIVFPSDTKIERFCFSEDGNFIAIGCGIHKINEDLKFNFSTQIMVINNYRMDKYLTLDRDSTKAITSGPDDDNQLIISVNDFIQQKTLKLIPLESLTLNISANPLTSNLFAYGCLDGSLFLHDLRTPNSLKIEDKKDKILSLQYHPLKDNFLLVASQSKEGIYMFDIRNKKPIFNYSIAYGNERNTSCVRFNKKGDQFFLTRYAFNPVLFDVNQSYPVYEFTDYGYLNIEFNTNCCFAGPEDDYVVAPSSDNNVYMWKVPKTNDESYDNDGLIKIVDSANFVLKHLSSTKYVGYNYQRCFLGCGGGFESLKLWSPFPFLIKPQSINIYKKYISNFCLKKEIMFDKQIILDELIDLSFVNFQKTFIGPFEKCEKFHFKKPNIINEKNFMTELKDDENIKYIQSFIKYYDTNILNIENKIFDKAKDALQKASERKKIFEENQLSTIVALFKVFKNKSFMKKSIEYLNKQISFIENLKEEINNNSQFEMDHSKKLCFLKEKSFSLEVLVNKLEIIISKKREFYESSFEYIMKLLYDYDDFSNDLRPKLKKRGFFYDSNRNKTLSFLKLDNIV